MKVNNLSFLFYLAMQQDTEVDMKDVLELLKTFNPDIRHTHSGPNILVLQGDIYFILKHHPHFTQSGVETSVFLFLSFLIKFPIVPGLVKVNVNSVL